MKKIAIIFSTFAALTTSSVSADTVGARHPGKPHKSSANFVRMFPRLPAFTEQTNQARTAAGELGARFGPLDAEDNLSDPVQSIINQPVFSPNNADNPEMTAGITFVGQFLDHDITFDRLSDIGSNANPEHTVNFRSAAFDLDNVYGEGPAGSPELYERTSGLIKFRIEAIPGSELVSRGGATRYDLPREPSGEPIMADSRNDENVIVSQWHLAILRFHNAVTDQLASDNNPGSETPEQLFSRAQQMVQWHYQWIILNEFLPLTIGQERVDALLRDGPRHYQTRRRNSPARIPIEFSAAAYRFGHSQVRPSYRLNFGADADSQFFALILNNAADPHALDPDDLRGGKRAPRRFVDWQTFFDFGDGNVRNNKLIDTKITSNLFELPGSIVPAPGLPTSGPISLASRNLIRHVNFGLPSGQSIARAIGETPLTTTQLVELAPYGFAEHTPLWYYILKEAELLESGIRLGPVGATIVGEVFIGLLQADPSSYLSVQPDWRPVLPSRLGSDRFDIVDLLTTAGVAPPLD
ncbi:MAG: peroxidase family protein [Burkholderiaceae bacterium]